MNIEKRIIENESILNENDLEIISSIKELKDQLDRISITELAKNIHSSKSTISRVSQKLGFSGYSELKYALKNSKTIGKEDNHHDYKLLLKNDILNTIKLTEQTNFITLVQEIYKANIVFCYGTGNSQRMALEEFSRLLMTVDKKSIVIPVSAELRMSLSMMTKRDLLIISSLSGETHELVEIYPQIKSTKIKITSITNFSSNYLSQNSDLSYYYYSSKFFGPKSKANYSLSSLSILLDVIYREYLSFSLLQKL